MKRLLLSLMLAGSTFVPASHLLAGTAHAANSQVIPFNCPGFGDVLVQVNGNGAAGHVVDTHLIGVDLSNRGNAGTATSSKLVTCTSPLGFSIQVLLPAGR